MEWKKINDKKKTLTNPLALLCVGDEKRRLIIHTAILPPLPGSKLSQNYLSSPIHMGAPRPRQAETWKNVNVNKARRVRHPCHESARRPHRNHERLGAPSPPTEKEISTVPRKSHLFLTLAHVEDLVGTWKHLLGTAGLGRGLVVVCAQNKDLCVCVWSVRLVWILSARVKAQIE